MNILKTTSDGIVVITKIGISPKLAEKLENCGSYYMKTIKKKCDKIASWEVVDNDIVSEDEEFPKIIKATSVPFNEVDANCVSTFANVQEKVVSEILEAEAANLKVEKVTGMLNFAFVVMLDTSFTPEDNDEN